MYAAEMPLLLNSKNAVYFPLMYVSTIYTKMLSTS